MGCLWTSEDVAIAIGSKKIGTWRAFGISTDTRTLKKGDIFFAISGKRDGNEYVETAFKLGAAAAIVSRAPRKWSKAQPVLIVQDVINALSAMASFAVNRSSASVIAITGSVGKTSSKDMMAFALRDFGKVHKAEKSFNNHIGVPLTLASAPADSDFIVVEIGMSNRGEILPLSLLASPHVVLITNVSAAHLSSLKNVNEIAREKSDICRGLRQPRIAVISRDSECFLELLRNVKKHSKSVLTFGEKGSPHYKLIKTVSKRNTTCAQIAMPGGITFYFKVNSPGKHNAVNALGVLVVLSALKLDIAKGILAIADWWPTVGRGSLTEIICETRLLNGIISVIDETYNANPKSMEAAIDTLSNFEHLGEVGVRNKMIRRVAIIGDMLELGTEENRKHEKLVEKLNLSNVDLVHCIGHRMKFLYNKLPISIKGKWYATVDEMIPRLHSLVRVNDAIMLKASNDMGLHKLKVELTKLGKNQKKRRL